MRRGPVYGVVILHVYAQNSLGGFGEGVASSRKTPLFCLLSNSIWQRVAPPQTQHSHEHAIFSHVFGWRTEVCSAHHVPAAPLPSMLYALPL